MHALLKYLPYSFFFFFCWNLQYSSSKTKICWKHVNCEVNCLYAYLGDVNNDRIKGSKKEEILFEYKQ